MTRVPGSLLAAACIAIALEAKGDEKGFILLQSTTSTQNSGLYEWILPKFSAATGIEVRVVAVGTGQALMNAANCDADLVIAHDSEAEAEFVDSGYGIERFDLMYNDFVIVGPSSDPAGIANSGSAAEAFAMIAEAEHEFVSRGDLSGTNKKELAIWRIAGIKPSGRWYLETGSGMGTALNISVGKNAYTLSDRATWLRFRNKAQHAIVFEGGRDLFNQYGIVAVDPNHCPSAKTRLTAIFVDWMLSKEGQRAIGEYSPDGTQLFVPNAVETE